MCALPKRFDAFVMWNGTHAGKNPRHRELFDGSMCGDIRCFRVGIPAPAWVEACIASRCEEVRHGR